MFTNLWYADDIILLATLEAELQTKIRLTKALVWPVASKPHTAVKAGHSERMKKHVLRPLTRKD